MKSAAADPSRAFMIAAVLCAVGSVLSAIAGVSLLVAGFSGASAPSIASVVGGGDSPARAGFSGGSPRGLYFMTRFWSYTGTLEKAAWYFAPDGTVYRDLESGFSGSELAQHKGPRGTYSVEGGKMTITWSDGKKSTSEIERDDPAFTWDMGIFTPVQPFDDEDALVAEWEGGESLSTGGNHASVSKSLQLREDGTFTWSAVSFLKGETDRTVVSGGGQGATEGSWKLDGYSLSLTSSGGQTFRGIAFPYDDDKTPVNPDRFFFAGTMYKRR
jgi:hypothetical protein